MTPKMPELEEELLKAWEAMFGNNTKAHADVYVADYKKFLELMKPLIHQKVIEGRIDELEKAWDWAAQNNQSYIKGAWILKRVRKLKATLSQEKAE